MMSVVYVNQFSIEPLVHLLGFLSFKTHFVYSTFFTKLHISHLHLTKPQPSFLCKILHCSKKLKEHFENTSDLNVKKYYVGYLY